MQKHDSQYTHFRISIKIRDELKVMAKQKGFTMAGLINHFIQKEKSNKSE